MSSQYKTSGSQITKNSIYLFLRQILILIVGLITVRVTLQTLGAEDYGVYNVVAGSVTIFSFLVGAVGMGAQRYFSFYLANDDKSLLNKVFANTFTIYIILAILIVILIESIGLYLLESKLVIPACRMHAAHVIFQLACVTLVFNIVQAPFMALVIAHENMKVFAQLGIYDAMAKLILVFLLILIPGDKLILYAFLHMLVAISCSLFYMYFCIRHYEECKLRFMLNKSIASEILSYNGWNLWGQMAGVVKVQGISIILNSFLGPIINAAMQIANQVRGLSVTLSQNFTAAVNPQIIKSYSANDTERLFRLTFSCAKANFILMCVMILPIICHVDFLLKIWLGDIPEYTVMICKLLLFDSLIEVASSPFATINQATGKIALYQFLIGIVGLLNLPFAYIALKYGLGPKWVFIIGIILQCCIATIRVVFVNRVKRGVMIIAIIKVYLPCLSLLLISLFLSWLFIHPASSIATLFGFACPQILAILILAYVLVLDKNEKHLIHNLIRIKG